MGEVIITCISSEARLDDLGLRLRCGEHVNVPLVSASQSRDLADLKTLGAVTTKIVRASSAPVFRGRPAERAALLPPVYEPSVSTAPPSNLVATSASSVEIDRVVDALEALRREIEALRVEMFDAVARGVTVALAARGSGAVLAAESRRASEPSERTTLPYVETTFIPSQLVPDATTSVQVTAAESDGASLTDAQAALRRVRSRTP